MTLNPFEYGSFRESLNEKLHTYIQAETKEIQNSTSIEFIRDTAGYLAELLEGGGKRVRGYCAAQMYACSGGTDEEVAYKAALAIELFHMFALVQDDVMDEASSRRGITTMHVHALNWLQSRDRSGALQHVAEMQAVLWGDLLLMMSQRQMIGIQAPKEHIEKAFSIFHTMSVQTMIGQMGDMDTVTRHDITDVELEEKTKYKTAYYSFVRPMQLGVALAGGDESLHDICEEYGVALGMAFQIQDDCFDVTRSEEQMGKPVMNDIQAGEHSYLSHYLLEHGSEAQKQEFRGYFGRRLSADEIEAARSLFVASGAVEYADNEAAMYFSRVEEVVKKMPSSMNTKPWKELIALVRDRKS